MEELSANQLLIKLSAYDRIVRTVTWVAGDDKMKKIRHRASLHIHRPTKKKVLNYDLIGKPAEADTLEEALRALLIYVR